MEKSKVKNTKTMEVGVNIAEVADISDDTKKKYLKEAVAEVDPMDILKKLKGGQYCVDQEKIAKPQGGIKIERYFTKSGKHPYTEIEWEKRSAGISNDKGQVVFEQKDIEIPKFWSQLATNVVASKYFRGGHDDPNRESSVRDLVDRVAKTIAKWGLLQGYFATKDDARIFEEELTHLLINQKGSFNSPVWFNVGVEEHPQCSACFINSIEDKMESIMDLAKTEGMLFKFGSGTGTNLSTLRSSREQLSTGGYASGPVSFMKGYDAFAGVIKSGGKTRRAAKMVMLDIDHPDIMEFIECKVKEEKKAWALIDAGYDGSIDGEAYRSVFFQNANHSVRVSDKFMRRVIEDDIWYTLSVVSNKKMDTYKAKDVLRKIAESTYYCGDPGIQFDTIINDWNPVADTKPIRASNPCSEYMFVDDSSCNLASLNVMKLRTPEGEVDIEAFKHAVDIFIIAQDIVIDNAGYPRDKITFNSHTYRPLGLGYSNLGALLMSRGLPYDSEEGRAYAGAITAILTGRAYATSARLAEKMGTFDEYKNNANSFKRVISKHGKALSRIKADAIPSELMQAAEEAWREAEELGDKFGYRNAQVSVLAPTGTISFMMDCDTTGIEPDLALVKYKKLVGGGTFKIVNNTVTEALRRLEYPASQITEIIHFIEENDTIEGAPHMKPEHLPVFDCALRPINGKRSIHYMGHLRMMAIAQQFISGAISKTVNLPEEITVEEIIDTYISAWKLGLKAVAVYRNNSKRIQPLSAGEQKKGLQNKQNLANAPKRRKLPDERHSITHKFSISGHEGYVTVGMYEDGKPGEIFIVMSKEGSTVSGMLDGFATMGSLALQYGVPIETLVDKFSHMRFEPAGFTQNPQIPVAKSIYDYIFRWLAAKFMSEDDKLRVGLQPTISNGDSLKKSSAPAQSEAPAKKEIKSSGKAFVNQDDAPSCPTCGTIMVRSGACYQCINCGTQYGCG